MNILHTKDIGYMDEEGDFYINGRKDRMVKLRSIWIKLIELEKKLGNRFGCKMEKCMDTAISSRIRIIAKEGILKTAMQLILLIMHTS